CSRASGRWSCRGRSSIRCWTTGPRAAARNSTHRARGGRLRPTGCWPATGAPGAGRDRRTERRNAMIVTLRNTNSAEVGSRLVSLRDEGGAVALGRVLTLVVRPDDEAASERAIRTANGASHEHPMRVIVVLPDEEEGPAGLDAEIRVGGHAGASEVVVLRPRGGAGRDPGSLVMALLLPDAPIVTWWPSTPPDKPEQDPLGAMAQRRISESVRT